MFSSLPGRGVCHVDDIISLSEPGHKDNFIHSGISLDRHDNRNSIGTQCIWNEETKTSQICLCIIILGVGFGGNSTQNLNELKDSSRSGPGAGGVPDVVLESLASQGKDLNLCDLCPWWGHHGCWCPLTALILPKRPENIELIAAR